MRDESHILVSIKISKPFLWFSKDEIITRQTLEDLFTELGIQKLFEQKYFTVSLNQEPPLPT